MYSLKRTICLCLHILIKEDSMFLCDWKNLSPRCSIFPQAAFSKHAKQLYNMVCMQYTYSRIISFLKVIEDSCANSKTESRTRSTRTRNVKWAKGETCPRGSYVGFPCYLPSDRLFWMLSNHDTWLFVTTHTSYATKANQWDPPDVANSETREARADSDLTCGASPKSQPYLNTGKPVDSEGYRQHMYIIYIYIWIWSPSLREPPNIRFKRWPFMIGIGTLYAYCICIYYQGDVRTQPEVVSRTGPSSDSTESAESGVRVWSVVLGLKTRNFKLKKLHT